MPRTSTTWAKRSGIPAGGTHPPYPPGNSVSLRSGHRSPRVYGELATRLAAGLLADRPDVGSFPEAVAAWATAEATAALLRRHLSVVGAIDPESNAPRSRTLADLAALERAAAQHRAVLGLDPTSEARLTRERAEAATLVVDLAALEARGAAALAARAASESAPPPDLAGEVLAEVAAEGARVWAQAKAEHEAKGTGARS